MAFLLDSPRVIHCFAFTAGPNPALAARESKGPRLEFLPSQRRMAVGRPFTLRFRITDASGQEPAGGLRDVVVHAILIPGSWNQRFTAVEAEEGVYEISFAPPRAKFYVLTFSSGSLGADARRFPYLSLRAAQD